MAISDFPKSDFSHTPNIKAESIIFVSIKSFHNFQQNRLYFHGSLEGIGSVLTSEVCHSKADISETELQLF